MPDTIEPGVDEGTRTAALLQLASAALPIGGFGYSGGLEAAVDAGLVSDEAGAERWLGDVLNLGWSRGEAVCWRDAYEAWSAGAIPRINASNDAALAQRDTSELRLESTQMGRSLALWLMALPPPLKLDPARAACLSGLRPIAHACAHAAASLTLGLSLRDGLRALGWSLVENGVLAAVKLVPLGQDAGQRVLRKLALQLEPAISVALQRPPHSACNFTPGLIVLSSRHETQYTRLFRS